MMWIRTAICAAIVVLMLVLFRPPVRCAFDRSAACVASPGTIARTVQNVAIVQQALDRYARAHNGRYPASLGPGDFDWRGYVSDAILNDWTPDRSGERIVEASIPIPAAGSRERLVAVAQRDRRIFRWPGTIRYYVDRDSHRFFALTGSQARGALLRVPGGDGKYTDNWVLHN